MDSNVKKILEPLTALRFFAAAMIVAYHAAGRGLGPDWVISFALGQGVSFFFLLSGFVLAYNYPSLSGWREWKQFYWARIARIWPSHVGTAFLYIALIGNISYFALPQHYRVPITVAYLTLTHAWIPISEFIIAYNTVSWSISTEFFFYLAFPILIWNWATNWRLKVLLTFLLTCMMWWLATRYAVAPNGTEDSRTNLAYINPLARVFEFVIGIGICGIYKKYGSMMSIRLRGGFATSVEIGVVALVILGLWASRQVANSPWTIENLGKTASILFGTTGFGTLIFALVILIFAVGGGGVSRFLSTRPMVFLGEISFGLYLVHTLFLLYRQQAPGVFSGMSLNAVYALYWACGLALAILIHLCVEKPGQKLIRTWANGSSSRAPYAVRAWSLLALFLLCVGAMVVFQPSTRSPYVQSIASEANLLQEPIQFGDGYRLESVELLPNDLRFRWTAVTNVSLAKRVAVHLLDAEGVMQGQLDFAIETGYRQASEGEHWSNLVARNGAKLGSVKTLGIAVYDEHGMTAVVESQRSQADWNGQRLLVALNKTDADLGRPKFASELKLSSLVGDWAAGSGIARINEGADGGVSLTTEGGVAGEGRIDGGKISVPHWGVEGRVTLDGKQIAWSNGFFWRRP